MEKDLLQEVIKVEEEIQQTIEAEKKKAAAWLESERTALSRELEDRKLQLEKEFSRSFEAARRECEIQAEKEIAAVNQLAENLQNIPDAVLQEVVRKSLQVILPEDNRRGQRDR